jgi:hypothetical protein
MAEQVSRGVSNKRKFIDIILDIVFDNAFVQPEKNAQAGLREDCVCGFESDVILGEIPTRTRQPIRREELLDRKV